MAKCIKEVKSGKIVRVSNEEATKKVDSGKYEYVSKSMWRRFKVQQEK